MLSGIARLQQNDLFGNLTEDELCRLPHLSTHYVIIEDATLFAEGRTATHLYIVAEGQIALQKAIRARHAKHSRRTTIAVCHPGEVLGWSSLIEPYKYTLSAVAWGTSRLVRIDAKMLRRTLDTFPEMGYKIMGALSEVMSRRLEGVADALTSERETHLAGL
jgi:CRP/FNR family cyclic AMP-dependent transcriptional regulator